ncbi:ribosomal protein S18-alanine N-acetyltransferase [Nocardioides sp.]|uniref:ribosomal protein S18-alanine N-acetyltransferase n=1 Tax=Nocardioides sp. TaxID=35761 RepID=UPI002723122F|nr:ribosomal protein S18-alanine N-acetyltransferase [Nocardioides sp.]MDO9454662.1 ribosomal protein S18-alanine N-acetyltransferase [Nocardioides sp.]
MIRVADAADADALADLEADNLGDDAWSPGLVAAGVSGELPTVTWWAAEIGSVVIGYAVASIVADIAELQRVAVDPAHRRRGVARELLDEVRRVARAEGADRLLLEVREDNAGAIAFYADLGFVEIDRRRRYYRDGATAIVLRLPLVTGCGSSGSSG